MSIDNSKEHLGDCYVCVEEHCEERCDRCSKPTCSYCLLSDTDFAERGEVHADFASLPYNSLCAHCYGTCRRASMSAIKKGAFTLISIALLCMYTYIIAGNMLAMQCMHDVGLFWMFSVPIGSMCLFFAAKIITMLAKGRRE